MTHDPKGREPPAELIEAVVASIGKATIVTDAPGRLLLMDPVAQSLTGWPQDEAAGQPLAGVFRIEHEASRPPVTDPLADLLAAGATVGLADHTVMIARDGKGRRIDHGAAPDRDAAGTVVGAVLSRCDISKRQRAVQEVEGAQAFAGGIFQTVRQPLVVLDAGLRVRSANRSFYQTFRVTPPETEGQSFFGLGNRQWDSPRLQELLEQILPLDSHFNDFEVEHVFEGLGRRSMVLNAHRLPPAGQRPELILLALEDVTERRQAAEALAISETRYHRLFETSQDGILLVNPDSRRISDANPFLTDLLGYTRDALVGKELWEIGLFPDIESNKAAFRTLQETGCIRYENLPLRTLNDRGIEVEFVSHVYDVGNTRVIQCNIRDVTYRKRAEDDLRAAHAELELRVAERTAELAHTNSTLKGEIARREVAEAGRRDLQQQLTTVQEDERRRIARELHDQMGQHLTAIGLGLKVIKDATPDPCPIRERLQNLQSLTATIGRDVHHLALQLRPTALDDLGLQAALANYIEEWSERSGIEIDFHGSGLDTDRLPPAVETALYRVVQEALTNVLKHAAPLLVSVVLQRSPGLVSVVVEDDGRGFDPDTVAEHRLGLLGMRERAALVGGTLVVESKTDRGTTVIARVPLRGDDGGGRDD